MSVKLRHGPVERRLALVGKPATANLSRVLDEDFMPVAIPQEGLVLSSAVAEILRLRTGDMVEVEVLEGRRQKIDVPVSAIITGYLGLTAFMDIDTLNRLMGEGPVISGVHMSLDSSLRTQLFEVLKTTPTANFIALQYVAVQKFRDTLAQNIVIMVTVYATLAGIIAFGVVYNFARISLSEQGREMASLRVLGFTRGEVSGLLLGELAAVVLLAQPLGWLIGYGFAWLMAHGFASELYRVPLVVNREVFAWSSGIVIASAVLSGIVVRRRIDRLDMIEVLKTRE